MLILELVKWWYGAGWKQRGQILLEKLDGLLDFFSIGQLLRTLFSLFRQDGAQHVSGSFEVKMQAFFGRLISRVIGAGIRSAVIIVGILTITLRTLFGVALLLLWPLVPLLPIAGIMMSAMGWIPAWK